MKTWNIIGRAIYAAGFDFIIDANTEADAREIAAARVQPFGSDAELDETDIQSAVLVKNNPEPM